jgi:predicted DNA binding CopG/RHH family protein
MNAKKLKKIPQLSAEELALEKEIESGDWTDVPAKLKRGIIASAKDRVASKTNREARVNIRMTSETLELIQKLAAQEGIGYQTLMGSILHKYAHGLFIGTDEVKKVLASLGLKKTGSR